MWNLNDYETVEDRLVKFWKEHPDGRIETNLVEASPTRFIVIAHIFRTEADSKAWTSGLAEETITAKGVNQTSALENCETSAIGRALANAGYATKGKRPSREEMGKAARQASPTITVPKADNPWATEAKPAPLLATETMIQDAFQDAEPIPSCQHGPMSLKEGTSKTGNTYHGYVCKVSGVGPGEQCKPIWYDLSPSGKWMPPKPKGAK